MVDVLRRLRFCQFRKQIVGRTCCGSFVSAERDRGPGEAGKSGLGSIEAQQGEETGGIELYRRADAGLKALTPSPICVMYM